MQAAFQFSRSWHTKPGTQAIAGSWRLLGLVMVALLLLSLMPPITATPTEKGKIYIHNRLNIVMIFFAPRTLSLDQWRLENALFRNNFVHPVFLCEEAFPFEACYARKHGELEMQCFLNDGLVEFYQEIYLHAIDSGFWGTQVQQPVWQQVVRRQQVTRTGKLCSRGSTTRSSPPI